MPPLITTSRPGNLAASALEDEDVLDDRALLNGRIRNRLGGDRLTSSTALIGRDEHARFAVLHPVAKRLSGEAREHN